MANIKSAIKRAELNVKQNEKLSSKISFAYSIKAFNANPTEEAYRVASTSIDKAASKGLIHKTASR
ncbi:MAG: 30S ribosomal protein S20 [Streptococcus salivarius]